MEFTPPVTDVMERPAEGSAAGATETPDAAGRIAEFRALVPVCDALGQWRPGLTREECAERKIPRPDESHPVLRHPRYHQNGDVRKPLNRRGWNELDAMDYGYCVVTGKDPMVVSPRDESVNSRYHQELRNLNDQTPSPLEAAAYLERNGYTADTWDALLAKGLRDNWAHKLSAMVKIAQGDERPLGVIYHEVRLKSTTTVRGKVALHAARKATAAAMHGDPLALKPHYLG